MGRGHWNAEGHRTAAGLIAARLCASPAGAAAVEGAKHIAR
jgi:hypothetical protein